MMELFCLGIGNYSEQDIQQLARCFTGWEVQHGVFQFNSYQHDTGVKKTTSEHGHLKVTDVKMVSESCQK